MVSINFFIALNSTKSARSILVVIKFTFLISGFSFHSYHSGTYTLHDNLRAVFPETQGTIDAIWQISLNLE
jgi:hypothetical protein